MAVYHLWFATGLTSGAEWWHACLYAGFIPHVFSCLGLSWDKFNSLRPELSWSISGIILGMGSANERSHYIVTPPFIGWAHTLNDLWICSGKHFQMHFYEWSLYQNFNFIEIYFWGPVEISMGSGNGLALNRWQTIDLWLYMAALGLPGAGLILGLCPANERRHYKVTLSLIGWA